MSKLRCGPETKFLAILQCSIRVLGNTSSLVVAAKAVVQNIWARDTFALWGIAFRHVEISAGMLLWHSFRLRQLDASETVAGRPLHSRAAARVLDLPLVLYLQEGSFDWEGYRSVVEAQEFRFPLNPLRLGTSLVEYSVLPLLAPLVTPF